MNRTSRARLADLEKRILAFHLQSIWVTWVDTRIQVNIGQQHGEEMEFDTAREAAAWLEMQLSKFSNVTGLACVDIRDLLTPEKLEAFDQLYGGVPRESVDPRALLGGEKLEGAPETSVTFNLYGRAKESLVRTAMASWWHSLSGTGHLEWRASVAARVDHMLSLLDPLAFPTPEGGG